MIDLGIIYASSETHFKNIEKSITHLEKAVELDNNNSVALFELGNVYYGAGIKQTEDAFEKAYNYFEQAANLGHNGALFNMGYFNQFGLDGVVDVNTSEAIYYYEEVLKDENPEIKTYANLGMILQYADDDKKDEKRAFELYEIGSKKGSFLCSYQLGLNYYSESDFKNALKYFRLSVEQGDFNEAHNYLGILYENGYVGVLKDIKKAVEHFQKGANLGSLYAMTNLGNLYEFGNGVKKDLKKAMQLYEKAYNLGHDVAKCNYANALLKSSKTPANLQQAKSMIIDAYEKTDDEFCRNVYDANGLDSI